MNKPLRTLLICLAGTVIGCNDAPSPASGTVLAQSDDVGRSKTESNSPPSIRPGNDWPIFLGPHGTGVSDETGILDEWPESGPEILWEKRIGKGYSSPSVLGDKVVVHHRQRDIDVIECIRIDDGSPIWKYEYDTDFSDPYGYNNGPRCSPLLTETRCYTFGAQGRLVCLDLESGKLVWEHLTASEWKVPDHFFGAGCTPILEDNLLIVLVGGQPNSGVVAFDAETGKPVWESVGKDTWDGAMTDQQRPYKWTGDEMIVSYSSPIIATIHGEKHLLCLMRQGLVSLNPANGNIRFKYWFRARVHESVNAARPVVVDDLIFLSAAYETGAALLRVLPDGENFDVVWRNKRGMSTHWSTPIYQDGCVYGFSGRHEGEAKLQCVDLKSGELLWETNGYDGAPTDLRINGTGEVVDATGNPATFFGRGSKTAVDGKYIMLGERGTLVLGKLRREKLEQISRATYKQIRYPAWAAPVVSHGRLFLRSEDFLLCLNIAKSIE
jgi:outer membrane protein assembly factor BamB